jgi:hypothetical protein
MVCFRYISVNTLRKGDDDDDDDDDDMGLKGIKCGVWTELVARGGGQLASCCEHGDEPSGSVKCGDVGGIC